MVKIIPFKDYRGRIRYRVMQDFRFLGGGFASKESALKYKKYVLRNKEKLGLMTKKELGIVSFSH